MESKKILSYLAKRFPKRYAKYFHDYVGKMVGTLPKEVKKIYLCLDFDETIYEDMDSFHPDLIITHHPFIYGTRARVLKREPKKAELVAKLEKDGYCLYSFHTNFDTGKDGMNDALSAALGLKNVYTPEKAIMMRIGELDKKMPVKEFATYAKEKLNVSFGKLIAEGNKQVKKVGIIGGGGSGYYNIAQLEGCDIYISGDAPHHIRRAIVLDKMNYLDLPHEIEKIFMPQMKKLLLELDPSLTIKTIDHEKLPEII